MGFNNATRETVLIKIETTEGQDASPTPVANAIEVSDFSCQPTSDTVTRTPNRNFFVNDEISYPNKRYDISFKVELTGAGSAAVTAGTPPPYDPVMLCCSHIGVATPGTDYRYLPSSTAASTATIAYYRGDILYKAFGFRGSITDDMQIGERRYITISGTAVYSSPVDQVLSGTPDYSAFRKALLDSEINSTCNIHGVEVHGKSFSFNQNSTNEPYETTKSKTIINTNRQANGSLTISQEKLADFNAYALWESESGGLITWQTGTATGDIVILSLPNAQVGPPNSGADKSIDQNTFDIIPHPTPTGSDDEYVYIIK